jgi:CheY-like chemotaxis protein
MSAAQLQNLFTPFNRLGREASGIEGTGIGMALTRKLVELLGGSLVVNSEEHVGTRVQVRLPASHADVTPGAPLSAAAPAAAPTDGTPKPESRGPRGRILYVEDNPVNVILVEAMLEHWRGVELVSAADVETGVQLAKALLPDLVLLDMHIGAATGQDFLERIRADAHTAALRVVALSASAMPHEVQAAMQAGVMEYWTKPLDTETFRTEVSKLLSNPPPP